MQDILAGALVPMGGSQRGWGAGMWIAVNAFRPHVHMVVKMGRGVQTAAGIVEIDMAEFIEPAVIAGAQGIDSGGLIVNRVVIQEVLISVGLALGAVGGLFQGDHDLFS